MEVRESRSATSNGLRMAIFVFVIQNSSGGFILKSRRIDADHCDRGILVSISLF